MPRRLRQQLQIPNEEHETLKEYKRCLRASTALKKEKKIIDHNLKRLESMITSCMDKEVTYDVPLLPDEDPNVYGDNFRIRVSERKVYEPYNEDYFTRVLTRCFMEHIYPYEEGMTDADMYQREHISNNLAEICAESIVTSRRTRMDRMVKKNYESDLIEEREKRRKRKIEIQMNADMEKRFKQDSQY